MFNRLRALLARQPRAREQALPDYGLRYFDHLYGAYQSLPENSTTPYQALLDTLVKKRQEGDSLTWHDLYTFDLILTKLQPDENLPRIVWNLRSRYRDVAGLREYEAYIASKPPELAPAAQTADLRADIEYLLGQIHLRYAMAPIRARVNSALSLCMLVTIGVVLLGILLYISIRFESSLVVIVALIGAIGGLTSVQQRFQSAASVGDPVDSVSVFIHGWWDIFTSVTSGAIFAVVLYLLIAAGLLSGEVFPTMIAPEKLAHGTDVHLKTFLEKMVPDTTGDYAKLLIWSFIAGFAERFVPDTMSRFIERRHTETGGNG